MIDVASKRIGEFLRIVLQCLWSRPDGATTREILAYIPQKTRLSEAELVPFPSAPHLRMYEVRIGMAMAAVEKAGWLIRNEEHWFITDEGRLICKDFHSAEAFFIESQRIVEEWRLQNTAARLTLEDSEDKAWGQIRQYLLGLGSQEFRYLVKTLLEAMDYHILWIAPPEKTRGSIDMVACADPLGLGQPRLLVQLKHKGQPVTTDGVASSISLLSDNDLGLLVSSGGFTQDAKEFAHGQSTQGLSIMDLRKFYTLWVQYYDKLSAQARQQFPLKAVHFYSPEVNQ